MNAQIILTVVGALVKPGECVKIATIKAELTKRGHGDKWPRASVANACQTLVRRELLTQHVYTGALPNKHGGTPKKPGCYTLTTAGKAFLDEGRRIASGQPKNGTRVRVIAGGLRLKAWRGMRILQKFSIGDLVRGCAGGGETNAADNLRKYVRALTLAGYLTELRREPGTAVTSNGFKRWLLVRDTGPDAPVWNQAAGTVTDANAIESAAPAIYPMDGSALHTPPHKVGFDSVKFPPPSADFGAITHVGVAGRIVPLAEPLNVGAHRV